MEDPIDPESDGPTMTAGNAFPLDAPPHQTFDFEVTACGIPITAWTQHQMSRAIPVILCQRCAKAGGKR